LGPFTPLFALNFAFFVDLFAIELLIFYKLPYRSLFLPVGEFFPLLISLFWAFYTFDLLYFAFLPVFSDLMAVGLTIFSRLPHKTCLLPVGDFFPPLISLFRLFYIFFVLNFAFWPFFTHLIAIDLLIFSKLLYRSLFLFH